MRNILAAAALCLAATSAQAQMACLPVDAMRDAMADLDMSLVVAPVVNLDGGRVGQAEVWARETGDWIWLAIRADGIACAVLHGTDWHLGEGV